MIRMIAPIILAMMVLICALPGRLMNRARLGFIKLPIPKRSTTRPTMKMMIP